jgi:hypothetical protein
VSILGLAFPKIKALERFFLFMLLVGIYLSVYKYRLKGFYCLYFGSIKRKLIPFSQKAEQPSLWAWLFLFLIFINNAT